MILSHRIALDPTVKQREYFARAAGCDRFVWNLAVEQWNAEYAAGRRPKAFELRKRFNTVKYQQYPWMRTIHRDAHANAFWRITSAWFAYVKNPKKTGRPTFHKKGHKESFYVANDQFVVGKEGDEMKVRLPLIGWIRMREKVRFSGKIMGARVFRKAQRWFLLFQVDVGEVSKSRKSDAVCGVDLGLHVAATVVKADGSTKKFFAPKPLIGALKKLRRIQRAMGRRKKGGSNRRKLKVQFSSVHARIANVRMDFWHKLTHEICSENQAVGIENLNIQGMMCNRRMYRAFLDAALGKFEPLMLYKSKLFGTRLAEVSPWFPSSKTCSVCGHVKETLNLSERVFFCEQCGNVKDRDQNAGANLCAVAEQKIPVACGESTLGDNAASRAVG